MKELVASAVAKKVTNGQVIGLGSGTTVELAIRALGRRVREEKLEVFGVPTSQETSLLAERNGLRVLSNFAHPKLDWAFDGADEIDPALNAIKGRGAAMLLEKIIAKKAGGLTVVITEDKLVDRLGRKFAIPVEVVPEALEHVSEVLLAMGAGEAKLRYTNGKYGPLVTEKGNFVLDVRFDPVKPELEAQIKSITGVVESGLFIGCVKEVLVARMNGVWQQRIVSGQLVEKPLETSSK